jgi:hypothetical protein
MNNLSDVSKSLSVTSVKIEKDVDNVTEIERIITEQIKVPLRTIAQIISTLLKIMSAFVGKKKRTK